MLLLYILDSSNYRWKEINQRMMEGEKAICDNKEDNEMGFEKNGGKVREGWGDIET